MIKFILISITVALFACFSPKEKATIQTAQKINTTTNLNIMEKVKFKSADGLEVTANLFQNSNPNAPVLLLCHQAGYSRGEYNETALKFMEMGYTCLALDQRSGAEINGVVNETAKRAKEQGLGGAYVDALPDVEAGLKYIIEGFSGNRIMMIGSSYSSALAIIMAANHGNDLEAIASFSPGDYFELDGLKVSDYALKVNIPVFITSAKNEGGSWAKIFANIPNSEKESFLPESNGFHGSKALWSESAGNEEYWKALTAFLEKNFPAS